MRVVIIAAIAGLLLAPVAASADPSASKSTELSAAAKKKEKVEYMKSAAGPEPVAPKKTKKKK